METLRIDGCSSSLQISYFCFYIVKLFSRENSSHTHIICELLWWTQILFCTDFFSQIDAMEPFLLLLSIVHQWIQRGSS